MSLSLRFHRRLPNCTPGSARPTPDRGIADRVAFLVRRPHETGDITSGVVEAEQERPQLGVPDDGERAGIDLDPLEQVEMYSQAIRNNRLDHVSVRTDDVAGVAPKLRVPVPHRADRAVLHVGQGLAARPWESRSARMRLHPPPSPVLGLLL